MWFNPWQGKQQEQEVKHVLLDGVLGGADRVSLVSRKWNDGNCYDDGSLDSTGQ